MVNQDFLTALSILLSFILSIFAVGISLFTFRLQSLQSAYSDIDKAYADILMVGIQNPELRKFELTSCYFQRSTNDDYRIRYESYAFLCWNIAETIFDRQKDKSSLYGVSSTWLPVIIEENRLHYHWFCRNIHLFKSEFRKFIMEQVNKIEITAADPHEIHEIFPFLERDFPKEELKSRDQFQRLIEKGHYHLYIAKQEASEIIVGYALLFAPQSPKIAWLDYIAIHPEYRNKGYGTLLFKAICNRLKAPQGILLEVEHPNSEDVEIQANQKRRISFYKRIGAKELKTGYLFPTTSGPVPMMLFFYAISNITVLKQETLRGIIKQAYDYIHDDVPNRYEILDSFIGTINDTEL